ncbi:MAG: VWA domain-containing protein [Gammaproteobacteria bacterium TMED1]|nr:MAG: VWA domain-containing protein [Gammaproteobacteria bacterium TMED1]|tara:strand:- start:2413 stop:3414 length:1002 start_codon:yes stop_codon:yes gene_type:complete
MKTKRREIEGLSLSFLDVISCGFGALILLLVLTKVFDPSAIDDSIDNLEDYLITLQKDLLAKRNDIRDMRTEIIRREDLESEETLRLTGLQAELLQLQEKYETIVRKTKVEEIIKARLSVAKQTLTEEMQRLLKNSIVKDNAVGGIPVDSEYVIFIIDTSGSMYTNAWPLVLQKVSETLEVYPKLKGIQVMNDMGNYMFSQYANEWIPDTAARRSAIINRLQNWNVFSNSSPVEGITKAISTFYRPDRKISLYVFGDDFSGRSVEQVIQVVDKINRVDSEGNRLVRIHGVGFPVLFSLPPRYQASAIRFSILMRELCIRNGGTFVALNDYRLL